MFLIFARFVFSGWDFCTRRWGVARGLEIFGNDLIFIEAKTVGVSANETLVEDASGQLVKLILFQGLKHAGSDLSGGGDLLQ